MEPGAEGSVARTVEGRLGDLCGEPYRTWRRSAHRMSIRTVTEFDVPGLEDALAIPGIPRDYRILLETLRAGMSSATEGEQDSAGNLRRTVLLEATPDRPRMRCVLVDHGGRGFYSRDGTRFGLIASTAPPAETEQALAAVDDLDLMGATLEQGPGDRMHLRATLSEEAVGRIVDARAILGPDASSTRAGGEIEITVEPEEMVIRLVVGFTSAHEMAGEIGFTSETVATHRDRGAVPDIPEPRLSMSMPAIEGIRGAFRLSTPRGARATKGSRGPGRRR